MKTEEEIADLMKSEKFSVAETDTLDYLKKHPEVRAFLSECGRGLEQVQRGSQEYIQALCVANHVRVMFARRAQTDFLKNPAIWGFACLLIGTFTAGTWGIMAMGMATGLFFACALNERR